jgi:hypothetical protein
MFVIAAVSLSIGGLLGRALLQESGPMLSYHFVPGERWHYQVRYCGRGTFDLGAIAGGSASSVVGGSTQFVQTVVETELFMDVIANNERAVLVAYSFLRPQVVLSLDAQPLRESAEAIAADMRAAVLAELDSHGRIQLVRFDPQTEEASRQFMRSLLATMQFVVPMATTSAEGWEAWEDSPNGRCRAVYATAPDAERKTLSFVKTRQEYDVGVVKPGPIDMKPTHKPGGALQFAFDPVLGQVRTIRGSETLIVLLGDKVFAEGENSLTLELLNKQSLPEADADCLRRLARDRQRQGAPESLMTKSPSWWTKLEAQKRELGDATLETLLADLAQQERVKDAKTDQMPLFRKISALIFVHPETSLRWGELVRQAGPESLTLRLVPSALAAAGHEQAQAALVAVLKSRISDEAVAVRLIPVLAMVERPSELAEVTLRDVTLHPAGPKIAASAQLGLGIMARSLKQDQPDRAEKIVAWAIGELETAQSVEMKHRFLLVLGNAGAQEGLPAIQKSLTDEDSGVRAAAVGALRFIGSDQAEALMTNVLGSDSEPQVRAETIRAFACRSKTQRALEACAKALQEDNSKSVRLAALNLMWQYRQKFPQVVSLVENAAKNDPADDLRKRAGELLGNELPE